MIQEISAARDVRVLCRERSSPIGDHLDPLGLSSEWVKAQNAILRLSRERAEKGEDQGKKERKRSATDQISRVRKELGLDGKTGIAEGIAARNQNPQIREAEIR